MVANGVSLIFEPLVPAVERREQLSDCLLVHLL
jgi:hypothetical protein